MHSEAQFKLCANATRRINTLLCLYCLAIPLLKHIRANGLPFSALFWTLSHVGCVLMRTFFLLEPQNDSITTHSSLWTFTFSPIRIWMNEISYNRHEQKSSVGECTLLTENMPCTCWLNVIVHCLSVSCLNNLSFALVFWHTI